MDPVTILSVAAAAAQFAELSVKITKRIAKYAARSIELPPEIVTINHRLKALQGCVSNIETRLRNTERDSSIDQGRLDDLSGFIKDLAKRCGDLNDLLGEYLPEKNDTRVERITKGFQSLSKDSDIKALSESMAPDSVVLMLSLATLDSAEPKLKPVQPATTKVITLVPTDRRVHDPVVRQAVIDQISQALATSDDDEPHVAILQGMGGQGKTQLAFEYCRQSKRDARYNGIFWVDAANESLASKTFAEIARKLTTNELLSDEDGRVRFVKETLESWTVPWLLVFDNYDDPKNYAIQKFFPASTLGHVLVTSRSQALSPLGRLVDIHGMTRDESLRLLFSHCRIERTDVTEQHATAIVERLGHLPLALAQAGAFLGEVRDTMKIGEFLEVYETKMKDILSTTPEVWLYIEQATSPTQQDQVKNVFTTWEFSMQLLNRGRLAGEKKSFLSVLSFFDISDISELLFELYAQQVKGDRPSWLALFEENGLWSTRRYAEVMTELKKLSLISSNVRSELDGKVHVSLHPLVRDWITLRSDQDEKSKPGFTAAASVLGHTVFALRRREDLMGDVVFDIDVDLERELSSHIIKWTNDHSKNLSLNSFEVLGIDSQLTPITLQWVLDEYVRKYVPGPLDLSASWWAWNHCRSTEAPWPAVRCLAGMLLCTRGAPTWKSQQEGMQIAREAVEIATEHQMGSIREIALGTLATRLGQRSSKREVDESRELFHGLIREASNVTRKFSFSVHLVSLLQLSGQSADHEVAEDLLLGMLEESELSELGGSEHRLLYWPDGTWHALLQESYVLMAARLRQFPWEKLAREFCHKMTSQSRGSPAKYGYFEGRNQLGRILMLKGKHEDAVKEFSRTISALSNDHVDRYVYLAVVRSDAMQGLADAYFQLGCPRESIHLLLKLLRFWTPANFHSSMSSTVRFRYTLISEALATCYESVDDRVGVCFAVHNYTEGFDEHAAVDRHIARQYMRVHWLGAWGKGLGGEMTESTRSNVDEVCGHLDEAMVAVGFLERTQVAGSDAATASGRWTNCSWAELRLEVSKTAEVPKGLRSRGAATTIQMHIQKANHLAVHGFSARAIESLLAVNRSFDCYSSLDSHAVEVYLKDVWATLWWLDTSGSLESTATVKRETIAWACQRARAFLGDTPTVKDFVRRGILAAGNRLVDHLPVGEPYTENLREEYLASLASQSPEAPPVDTPPTHLPAPLPIVAPPKKSVRATFKDFLRRSN